jgi:hypothetical protein
MNIPRALLLAGVLLFAAPGAAQPYPPPPPPPMGEPPPPPPPIRRAPPPYGYRLESVPNNVVRLSAGFFFASDGYGCWYGYACGFGDTYAWPNVNAEVDVGLSRNLALSIGANVAWGSSNGVVDNTIWEPHVDLLLRSSPASDIRGRFRVGLGIYAAHASSNALGLASTSDTGSALRIGGGVSFLNRSKIGIGLDGIFEAGSIGGFYVSTFQLLLGPELHF